MVLEMFLTFPESVTSCEISFNKDKLITSNQYYLSNM